MMFKISRKLSSMILAGKLYKNSPTASVNEKNEFLSITNEAVKIITFPCSLPGQGSLPVLVNCFQIQVEKE